jgi:hypothetical protein
MDQPQSAPPGVDGQDLRQHVELTPQQATARLAEIAAKRAAPQPSADAPASVQARARLQQLKSDPTWRNRLFAGNREAGQEFSELRAAAAAGGSFDDDGIETVDSVSNPHALSRSARAGLIDGLRNTGALSESSENFLQMMDAGAPVEKPTEGDAVLARAAREQLKRDGTFVERLLKGDRPAAALMHALNRMVAWSSPDGQVAHDEFRKFLTDRGLM